MHLGHDTFLSISWLYFTQQYDQLTSHSITVGGPSPKWPIMCLVGR